jgi:hypothetical protein
MTWKKKALFRGLLLSFLAAEYMLYFHASPQVLNVVFTGVFGLLYSNGAIMVRNP